MARAAILAIAAILTLLAAGSVAVAAGEGEGAGAADSQRVNPAFDELLPSGSVADTTIGGESGLRLLVATEAAHSQGLRSGDVLLAVDGVRPLSAWRPTNGPGATAVTWTVWRYVPGDRPVLAPAVLGRRTLDEFTALAPAERTPMRLALMLANRATLVRDGAGVLLLPPAASGDDAAWLRCANPMPAVSESALAEVSTALLKRVRIPPATGGEAAAARADLDARRFVEAEEHARRALLEIARDPARRAPGPEFDRALAMYVDAQESAAREREDLLAPEARFGFVAEGQVGRIQAFPAQHTLHVVDNSTGWAWAAGIRLGWPGGGPAVLADFSLLAEYGQVRNTFESLATGPGCGEEAADGQSGVGGFSSTLQQITGEILYRPRVASRLKPYLRGGVGAFPLRMLVQAREGYRVAFERTNVGFVAGGGIDMLRIPAAHLRVGVGGTYRVLKYKIAKENAPEVASTQNTECSVITTVDNNDALYLFDMDGWQVGLMLTFEP